MITGMGWSATKRNASKREIFANGLKVKTRRNASKREFFAKREIFAKTKRNASKTRDLRIKTSRLRETARRRAEGFDSSPMPTGPSADEAIPEAPRGIGQTEETVTDDFFGSCVPTSEPI